MNAFSKCRMWCCVTVALVMSLTACSRKDVSEAPNTVLVWHWMTDRDDSLQVLAENYKKATGVTIKLELYAPSDAYTTKVRAAAQTSTLPDIFSVLGESRDVASFINSGHIANLQPFMDANGGEWKKQIFPKALATTAFLADNQYKVMPGNYGVPIDVTNIQMLYNKDLFKKAGLDPEHPPKTWDEFLKDNAALKAAGIPGFVSGWGETWLIDCFANNYAFNIMGEQKVLDTYRGKVAYTDPDWLKVLGLFEQLRTKDVLVSGMVTMVNKTAEQMFATGKAAFAMNGSWCVNVYRGMNPDLNYGVMLPPAFSSSHSMKIWGGAGSSFMVNAHSKNLKQAVDFLRWLSEPEQQVYLSKETLNLPSNRKSLKGVPAVLAAFASQMDVTTHPSQWPVNEAPTVTEALDKGIQSILIGEKTAQQVAEDVEAAKKNAPEHSASHS
jgi:ABC-type glycerol-3-phosphate transport system substrate-binding protein